jgi:hypothetical protein
MRDTLTVTENTSGSGVLRKKNAEERGVAKELLYLLKYVCYFLFVI